MYQKDEWMHLPPHKQTDEAAAKAVSATGIAAAIALHGVYPRQAPSRDAVK
jgi:hypothetical protein